ncbi:MAG: hypothetical protein K6E22_12945 [Treponema sp.]|nr:hypothetical protein [Treponema sp.]
MKTGEILENPVIFCFFCKEISEKCRQNFAKKIFRKQTKPTPDWKGGAARPPEAGRSGSGALQSGLASKAWSKKKLPKKTGFWTVPFFIQQ